jgi:hypothetical protein
MEQTDNQVLETQQTTSLMTRITNVFASPSELYTEVSANPVQTSSWVFPLILSLIISLFFVTAIYYNDALRSQIYEMQEEKMQEIVEQGKMTQQQYDSWVDGMENSGPGMFIAFGGISEVVKALIVFFGASLILWLFMKIALKFGGGYKKVLEVWGLASFIGIFGSVITMLLMYLFNSMTATPSPTLFLGEGFDAKNSLHVILASLNIFTIWQMGIVGLGLSKISNKSIGLGLGVAYGLWIIWVLLSTFLGFGMR